MVFPINDIFCVAGSILHIIYIFFFHLQKYFVGFGIYDFCGGAVIWIANPLFKQEGDCRTCVSAVLPVQLL